MTTTPCEYCGRALAVRVETDGRGGTVDEVQPCGCDDAMWRRGECIRCGVHVPRTHPKRLGKKRCEDCARVRRREHQRDYRRRNPGRDAEREREKYHNDPRYRLYHIRKGRERWRMEKRVRERMRRSA